MYKLVGIQFKDLASSSKEALHCHMSKLTSYLRGKDSNYKVDVSKNRESYRLPLDPDLPSDMEIEAWIFIEELNRFVKTRLKDISVGGLGFIPPFPDLKKKFSAGNKIKIVLRFGKFEIPLEGEVKGFSQLDVSRGQKLFLKNILNRVFTSKDKKGSIEILFSKEDCKEIGLNNSNEEKGEWVAINLG